jgi:hypothetical protein
MPLKNRAGVEILMLKDLTGTESDRVAHDLRHLDAKLAELVRTSRPSP